MATVATTPSSTAVSWVSSRRPSGEASVPSSLKVLSGIQALLLGRKSHCSPDHTSGKSLEPQVKVCNVLWNPQQPS